MQITSYYSVQCTCGRSHRVEQDKQAFTCACGARSVVDFRSQLSMGELTKLLDGLMTKADGISVLIEQRRERLA